MCNQICWTCWTVGYSPGGITINYNTPNITRTSGLLIARQFITVISTVTYLSSFWKLASFGTPRELLELHYIASVQPSQKTPFYCWNGFTKSLHSNGRGADCIGTSHTIHSQRIHWCTACCPATSNKHLYFYCFVRFNVLTESLPSKALAIHVNIILLTSK
jgi:hypothetical protein